MGEDALLGGPSLVVHLDKAQVIHGNFGIFETEAVCIGMSADGDQDSIEGFSVVLALDSKGRFDGGAFFLRPLERRGCVNGFHLLAKLGHQRFRQIRIKAVENPLQSFDDRHFAAQRCVDLPDLQTDVAAADDQKPFGHFSISRASAASQHRSLGRIDSGKLLA